MRARLQPRKSSLTGPRSRPPRLGPLKRRTNVQAGGFLAGKADKIRQFLFIGILMARALTFEDLLKALAAQADSPFVSLVSLRKAQNFRRSDVLHDARPSDGIRELCESVGQTHVGVVQAAHRSE